MSGNHSSIVLVFISNIKSISVRIYRSNSKLLDNYWFDYLSKFFVTTSQMLLLQILKLSIWQNLIVIWKLDFVVHRHKHMLTLESGAYQHRLLWFFSGEIGSYQGKAWLSNDPFYDNLTKLVMLYWRFWGGRCNFTWA